MAIIPWSKLEKFAELYKILIVPEIYKKTSEFEPQSVIEARLPLAFKTLHSSLTSILREHVSEDFRREEQEIDK
jgi:hypothetical protein